MIMFLKKYKLQKFAIVAFIIIVCSGIYFIFFAKTTEVYRDGTPREKREYIIKINNKNYPLVFENPLENEQQSKDDDRDSKIYAIYAFDMSRKNCFHLIFRKQKLTHKITESKTYIFLEGFLVGKSKAINHIKNDTDSVMYCKSENNEKSLFNSYCDF